MRLNVAGDSADGRQDCDRHMIAIPVRYSIIVTTAAGAAKPGGEVRRRSEISVHCGLFD